MKNWLQKQILDSVGEVALCNEPDRNSCHDNFFKVGHAKIHSSDDIVKTLLATNTSVGSRTATAGNVGPAIVAHVAHSGRSHTDTVIFNWKGHNFFFSKWLQRVSRLEKFFTQHSKWRETSFKGCCRLWKCVLRLFDDFSSFTQHYILRV